MSVRHALAMVVAVGCCFTSFTSRLIAYESPTTAPTTAPVPSPATAPATSPTTAPASTAPTDRAYTIEDHGELKLAIPAGWNEREEPPQPGIPRTIRLISADGRFEMLISILAPPPGMPDFNSRTKLRAIAEMQGKHLLGTSKETSVVLEEIKTAPGGAFLYTLSDKAPAPGQYAFISGGVVGVGNLILSTTMLMHERNPPERAKAIEVLAGATHAKPTRVAVAPQPSPQPPTSTAPVAPPVAQLPAQPSAQPPASNDPPSTAPTSQPANGANRLAVSLPDKTWQLVLDRADLQILQDEIAPNRRARHVAAVEPGSGVHISIFLEPAATIGDARLARSFFFDRLKRSPLQIRDDKFSEIGEIARVDYLLPDANQRHANLYISREGVWIDVHISVEDAKNEKLALIDEIAKAVRVESKPRATK